MTFFLMIVVINFIIIFGGRLYDVLLYPIDDSLDKPHFADRFPPQFVLLLIVDVIGVAYLYIN